MFSGTHPSNNRRPNINSHQNDLTYKDPPFTSNALNHVAIMSDILASAKKKEVKTKKTTAVRKRTNYIK